MTNKLKEIMDTFKDDFSNMWHLDDGITLHKLEDFIRESCTAYGRSLIPEDNMDGDINHSAAFGYFQCKNNILDRISQDELSLGEEEKYEFWFNTHIKCDNNHETVLCSVEKFCDYPVCPRCGSRAMVTGTNKTPMREEDTLNNK